MLNSNAHVAVADKTAGTLHTTRIFGRSYLVELCWIAAFVSSVCLNIHLFFLGLQDLEFDEFTYIGSGRSLDHLHLPVFAMNPFVSLLYGVLYVPFHRSPYWLIHEARIGYVLSFSLIWLSTYWVVTRVASRPASLFAAALLLGFPFYGLLLANSTDALFTAFSGLALGFALEYVKSRNKKFLLAASAVLGIASMTRNDGLVMEASFLCIALILETRWAGSGSKPLSRSMVARLAKPALAATIPFFVLVAGYLVLTKVVMGSVQWGVEMRTYDAFQQGEGIAYDNYLHHGNWEPYDMGYVLSDQKYGTQDSNQSSVLRAIMRNPRGYADRVGHALKYIPGGILTFINQSRWSYGYSAFIVGAAMLGLLAFVRKSRYDQIVVVGLWHLHLLTYFITFFRTGYFMLTLVTITALAAVGLKGLQERFSGRVLAAIAVIYGLFFAGAFVLGEPYLLIGLGASSVPLAVPYLSRLRQFQSKSWTMLISAVQAAGLIMVGILTHVPFDTSPLPSVGESDEAAASVYIAKYGRRGPVAGYDPGAALMARRTYVDLGDASPQFGNTQQFEKWMTDNGIAEVILDPNFETDHADAYTVIQSDIGKHLHLDYRTPDGDYEVLSQENYSNRG